jgi:hypothetical protein
MFPAAVGSDLGRPTDNRDMAGGLPNPELATTTREANCQAQPRRRQVPQQDDRHFLHPEFLGRQQTSVPGDDIVFGADQDWVCPAEFLIDAAMLATCSRLWVRGLLARGIRRSIGQRSIWMSIFGPRGFSARRSMRFAIDISTIEPLAFYTR